MGKSKAEPVDYAAAAAAEGQANKENIAQQTYGNRSDHNNPWGSTKWSNEMVYDPATEQNVTKWTQNETLSPDLQRGLDAQSELIAER